MSTVSIRKTAGDDYAGILAAVRRAVEDLGGLGDIIKPGMKVLVKPNLVAVPATRLSGAVTRWEVAGAVAQLAREAGASPIIAESAAAGVNTRAVIEKCEYDRLRDLGFAVVDLKQTPRRKIAAKGAKLIASMDSWELVAEAEAVISVPVLKTHDQTEVTLGLKNLKGLIEDEQKKIFHAQGVMNGVIDIVSTLRPVLTVIDGTYGQEGLGPIFGDTVRMDLILASKDVVAADAVGSAVMGYQPEDCMLSLEANRRGLGEISLAKIEVKGESIASVARRFKRASEVEIEGLPPHRLLFDEGACTGCRNTVISSLMDLKSQGHTSYLEGKILVAGPLRELPPESTPENTVLIGKCANHLKDRGRAVRGCPPGNVYVVQGIVGDALEVGRRYNAD
ncbi:MAG: DUF362 domain-containing protein [Deltaproteobacteria bacterium]|jgi:uncharacterized protein (DUF362 family)|nr:DUF362 domain-containing protein [Deltaproteobacteria bacterium]